MHGDRPALEQALTQAGVPLDTNQFTTELVQFSQVEQQLNTNSSLGSLIQLTQAGDLTQASAMLGSKVSPQASQIPLQNGTGSISFIDQIAGPAAIAIYDSTGQQIKDVSLTATAGQNNWNWDGTNFDSAPGGRCRHGVMAGVVISGVHVHSDAGEGPRLFSRPHLGKNNRPEG